MENGKVVIEQVEVLGFSHVGFVVSSVEEFQASWGTMLGIGDWLVREVPQAPGKVQVDGRVVVEPSAVKVAFARFRGTSIELVEPLSGTSGASVWLERRGGGINHLGVWVADLPRELARLGDAVAITYSPAALLPGTRETCGPPDPSARPPFWAYVEPVGAATTWALELLDARHADDNRAYYGGFPFYPVELPGTSAPPPLPQPPKRLRRKRQ